ncbi:hypothetical protein DFH07DRAFT_854715 [Mycena maculata]|uniref:Uncharacterized protein n=1 Tax=Mycena maculata TaxID=230809 RepID=A0AAD7HN87_9AGAR|nr:hypothetical protein DFH07DRAFT_854715 [Mycena maculata]
MSVPSPRVAPYSAPFRVPVPHVTSRSERPTTSSIPSSTFDPSSSTVHTSSQPSPPRKRRSRRCFVCGGTGKHRLSPRFCPRTFELVAKHLAKFNADFRLVSFDGSPLPMTRHPGGVAAHLLSPRRLPARSISVPPRRALCPRCGSALNPSHVPHAVLPHRVPDALPSADLNRPRVPHAVPTEDLNPSHTPPTAIVPPSRISCPNRGSDSNPPHVSPASVVHPRPIPRSDHSVASSILHFPPVERLPSPPVYLPIPVPLPDSKPPADASSEDSSPHVTLTIFELLFISPPIRNHLRKFIDAMDGSNIGDDIPSSPRLRKVFYRILDQIVDLLSSHR